LAGLTKSLYPGNTTEFVIHVHSEYDLRLRGDMRDEVFNTLKLNFLTLQKENLPIFGIAKAKQLSDFCTTEKDVARGISRVPILLARIYEEDVHIESKAKFRVSPKSQAIQQIKDSEKEFENLHESVKKRNDKMRTSLDLANS